MPPGTADLPVTSERHALAEVLHHVREGHHPYARMGKHVIGETFEYPKNVRQTGDQIEAVRRIIKSTYRL